MSSLEACASLLGLIAVWLTVRQNPWCWPIGLVMVVLYAWVFFQAKLYSNALLQFVYAALQLYGWWHWTRGEQPEDRLQVSRLSVQQAGVGLALGLLGSVGLGMIMASYTDASAPWQDATLCAFSLVAQLWMARKRLQCWLLWIVLDLLFVALFIEQALYSTAALYGLFTLLACHGWLTWRRELAGRTA